jgi:hypothetical protein
VAVVKQYQHHPRAHLSAVNADSVPHAVSCPYSLWYVTTGRNNCKHKVSNRAIAGDANFDELKQEVAYLVSWRRGIEPNITPCKRWAVQMQCACWYVGARVANFVQAHIVINVDAVARRRGSFRGFSKLVGFDINHVSCFLDHACRNTHPTSVARMIMNRRFLARIPTQ